MGIPVALKEMGDGTTTTEPTIESTGRTNHCNIFLIFSTPVILTVYGLCLTFHSILDHSYTVTGFPLQTVKDTNVKGVGKYLHISTIGTSI